MDTQQSRDILAAEEAKDRAVVNLRNATSMNTDDPRAKQLLEQAGDAYGAAVEQLEKVRRECVGPLANLSPVEPLKGPEAPQGAAGGDQSLQAGGNPPEGVGGPQTGGDGSEPA